MKTLKMVSIVMIVILSTCNIVQCEIKQPKNLKISKTEIQKIIIANDIIRKYHLDDDALRKSVESINNITPEEVFNAFNKNFEKNKTNIDDMFSVFKFLMNQEIENNWNYYKAEMRMLLQKAFVNNLTLNDLQNIEQDKDYNGVPAKRIESLHMDIIKYSFDLGKKIAEHAMAGCNL